MKIGKKSLTTPPEIISKKESESLWGETKKKERNFFAPESIDDNDYDNRYIIWLKGLSLLDQKNIVGYYDPPEPIKCGFRKNLFWQIIEEYKDKLSGNEENDSKRTSTPGYRLVKISKEADDSWRKADAHEAAEILQTIRFVLGEIHLEDEMHVVKEDQYDDEESTVLSVGAYRESYGLEVWIGKKKTFNARYREKVRYVWIKKAII